jgi:integrase
MADSGIYDRWHKSRPGDNEPRCAEHGLVPSAAHLSGDRWQARWRDDAGAQRKANFARKADASRHVATAVADTARGTYVDPRTGKITLREYAAGHLAGSIADATTREAAEIRWRVHILPALGDVPLGRLAARPSLIQSFVAGLTRADVAESYVRVILGSLSGALSAAVADQLIPRNPCASVRAPRPPRARVIPWTAERVAAVRAGLPAHYAALTDAGAGLGLRQGEGFGLAVDDVDFLRRMVHVRRQVRIVGGKLVFAPPKGGKERDVPLPDTVALRLSAHIAAHPPVPVTLPWRAPGGRDERAALLFTSSRAAACNRNTFNHGWRDALVAAGVPLARGNGFHALRHHFASVLLADGVDIRSLADYLGHHDLGFTLRVYAHMMPAAGERMRAAVDHAFAAPATPASAGTQR